MTEQEAAEYWRSHGWRVVPASLVCDAGATDRLDMHMRLEEWAANETQ